MTAGDPALSRTCGGCWNPVVSGAVAAVIAAGLTGGLLWIGASLFLPFVAMAVAAVAAWVVGKRAVAVGVVLGTFAWSALIVVALLTMGAAMDGFS